MWLSVRSCRQRARAPGLPQWQWRGRGGGGGRGQVQLQGQDQARGLCGSGATEPRPRFITTPIFYVNGDPHIGVLRCSEWRAAVLAVCSSGAVHVCVCFVY
jgi:hypothetical protein